MYYFSEFELPVGKYRIVSDGESIVGMWSVGQKYDRSSMTADMEENDNLPVFIQTKNWLDRYFAGEKMEIHELSLAPQGNEFQKLVWKYLCDIPYGETTTYGEIAKKVARDMGRERMSAQAVGGTVGRNPIGIIIPCHRVIGKDGSLTGYAGGLDIKVKLLTLEGLNVTEKAGRTFEDVFYLK